MKTRVANNNKRKYGTHKQGPCTMDEDESPPQANTFFELDVALVHLSELKLNELRSVIFHVT